MSELLLKDLDEEILDRLRERAKRNHRTLQAEAKAILRGAALREDFVLGRRLAARVRRRLAGLKDTDSVELLAEDRRR